MKCQYLEHESEIIHKDSKDNNNVMRCEHIHSIQLNNSFKNIQIEQISSLQIKNNSNYLNSYTIRNKNYTNDFYIF